jgi:hypothetical protein
LHYLVGKIRTTRRSNQKKRVRIYVVASKLNSFVANKLI